MISWAGKYISGGEVYMPYIQTATFLNRVRKFLDIYMYRQPKNIDGPHIER